MERLRLLHLFETVAAFEPVGAAELVRATGIPKATVSRALADLEIAGWIRRHDLGRPRYEVADRIRTLVTSAPTALLRRAEPVLRRLAAETGETAALWLLDGNEVTVAVAIEAPVPLRVGAPVGWRLPLHACAPGKALMAGWSDGEVRSFAHRVGLAATTMRTVTETEVLLIDLRRARGSGSATARDEEADGVTSAAAAIDARTAVGVVAPSARVDPEALAALATAAAAELRA